MLCEFSLYDPRQLNKCLFAHVVQQSRHRDRKSHGIRLSRRRMRFALVHGLFDPVFECRRCWRTVLARWLSIRLRRARLATYRRIRLRTAFAGCFCPAGGTRSFALRRCRPGNIFLRHGVTTLVADLRRRHGRAKPAPITSLHSTEWNQAVLGPLTKCPPHGGLPIPRVKENLS